jgi:hypothetical protein
MMRDDLLRFWPEYGKRARRRYSTRLTHPIAVFAIAGPPPESRPIPAAAPRPHTPPEASGRR